MNLQKLIKAVFFPLTEIGVLIAMLVFGLLLMLAGAAGLLGIWLAIIVIPAFFRYQMVLIESCARGVEPEPPGAEFFTLTHNIWTLFPFVICIGFAALAYSVNASFDRGALYALIAVQAFVYPAMLGVLAITHSPVQSLNPIAIYRFIVHTGPAYLVAPVYLMLVASLLPLLNSLNTLLAVFIEMFLVFSIHSVIGTIIQPSGIVDDVDIPDALEPDEATLAENLEANRAGVLAHAYGFISRNNREGGFKHIIEEIGRDPAPARAWMWYFERMQQWDESQHALFFAQHMIRDMLQHGETTPALKLLMRCRLQSEQFRPFREDIPVLIEAAENSANTELAAVLKAM